MARQVRFAGKFLSTQITNVFPLSIPMNNIDMVLQRFFAMDCSTTYWAEACRPQMSMLHVDE